MTNKVGIAPLSAVVAGVLFVAWTWLTLRTSALAGLDAWSSGPGVAADSAFGQVLAGFALASSPVIAYAIVAGLAAWAYRHRLTRLCWAMLASIPLGVGAVYAFKALLGRARPEFVVPLITSEGLSYPSAHMTAVTIAAVLIGTVPVLLRRRRSHTVAVLAALAALWWTVFGNRFWLRAHFVSDLIGGGFLGVFVATVTLAAFGVHINRLVTPQRDGKPRKVGLVFNPTKIPDLALLRRQLEGECEQRGWEPPLWLESDASDAGAAAARRARRAGVELVLVAGGDGTVRAVCAALSNSGIPVGILPAGTGNLLARNLGVPLDMAEALAVAFDGLARRIDLVEVRADDHKPQYSLVMAGMGADALIMADTDEDLKKVVGAAAYVMAALQALNRPPFRVRIAVGDDEPVERAVGLAMVANVGAIQGQIQIAPDAVPDDGLLDILIAAPEKLADWGTITTRILVGAQDAPGVERAQATGVVFEASTPVAYQLDGDAMGECRRLQATSLDGVVQVMVPDTA